MPGDNEEFQRLTTLLIEDRISEEELDQLNEMIRADSRLVDDYVDAREIDIAIRVQAWTPRSASQALVVARRNLIEIPPSPRRDADYRSDDSASAHLRAALSILIDRYGTMSTLLQILAVLLAVAAGYLIGRFFL